MAAVAAAATLAIAPTAAQAAPAPSAAASGTVSAQPGVPAATFSLKASKNAQTKTYLVPAPAAECAYLHSQHPQIAAKGCDNIDTVHLGPITATVGPPAGFKVPKSVSKRENPDSLTWYEGTASSELCSKLYGCGAWHSGVSTEFTYDAFNVYQWWVDCSNYGGFGYTIDVTWCGYWNNGGNNTNYMNMGNDFSVNALVKGFPIQNGVWQRINVDVTGHTWITYGY